MVLLTSLNTEIFKMNLVTQQQDQKPVNKIDATYVMSEVEVARWSGVGGGR